MKIQFSYSHEKNTSLSYNYFTLIKKKKSWKLFYIDRKYKYFKWWNDDNNKYTQMWTLFDINVGKSAHKKFYYVRAYGKT